MAERVLITGAGGFIGSYLAEHFLQSGYAVRVSDRTGVDLSKLTSLGAESIPASLEDREALRKVVKGVDVVIHPAAIFDLAVPLDRMRAVNVEGTRNLCEACLSNGTIRRFVQFSSVAVYGSLDRIPCKEEDRKAPRIPYEVTKWESEQVAFEYHRRHGLPVTALRPTLVYGPRSKYGHAMFLGIYGILKAVDGRTRLPLFDGGPSSHHVHVDDVVSAVDLLVRDDRAVGEAFNVADERSVSATEFQAALIRPLGFQTGRTLNVTRPVWKGFMWLALRVPGWLNARINVRLKAGWEGLVRSGKLKPELCPRWDQQWLYFFTYDQHFDTSKLKALGFKPKYPDFLQGIAQTIGWYREQGWLP